MSEKYRAKYINDIIEYRRATADGQPISWDEARARSEEKQRHFAAEYAPHLKQFDQEMKDIAAGKVQKAPNN